MKFARIELLYLVWIVPVLALFYLYGWRRRRHILSGYAAQRTLAQITPSGTVRRRRWGAVLSLSADVLTILALSGPQYGFQWQEVENQGIDIIIALDCSRSMLATDIKPTRLDRAKRKIFDLLNMLQGDRVGLVAFSGTAFLQCPLTVDYPAFYLFLDVLTPDYLPVGGTDLASAVQTAITAFDLQSRADKAVILITDGEHTGKNDPMEAVSAALKSGVKLFTIGVGSGDGVPVPEDNGGFKKDATGQIVLSKLDESLLSRMALTTGGSYVRSVAGDIDLETIYEEQIRARMESATVESGRKQIWADRYQWLLALAVALLLLTRWVRSYSKAGGLALALAGVIVTAIPAKADPLSLGFNAYQKGKYDEALQHYVEGQLKAPQNPELLYNIGNTYYKLKNFETAEAHYYQAMANAPPELRPRLLYNLGNSAYRRGRLDEAVRNYEAALQLNPDDPQIKENLAFVKEQLQKQQQDSSSENNQQNRDQNKRQQGNSEQQRQDGGPGQPQRNDRIQREEPSPATGNDGISQSEQPPVPDSTDGGQQGEDDLKETPRKIRSKGEAADQKAASQMLNRLKDQPGRAMMPDYKKQSVGKDW